MNAQEKLNFINSVEQYVIWVLDTDVPDAKVMEALNNAATSQVVKGGNLTVALSYAAKWYGVYQLIKTHRDAAVNAILDAVKA